MDDDSDDSSQIETLDQFREKWHKELNSTKRNQKQTNKSTAPVSSAHSTSCNGDDGEEKSKDHQVVTNLSIFRSFHVVNF